MTVPPSADREFRDFAKKPNRLWTNEVIKLPTAVGILWLLAAILLPAIRSTGTMGRSQCGSNLKQIMLALHSYAQGYGAFPPAYTVDARGRALHSWRTLILPWLGEEDLYRSIDLSKPWDDPANKKARESAVPVYQCPEQGGALGWTTSYLACVGPHAFLLSTEPRPLRTISDHMASTIAVIEKLPHGGFRHNSSPWTWMAPVDADESLVIELGPDVKALVEGKVNAAFVDGQVRALKAPIDPQFHAALRSVDGGETIRSGNW